MSARGVEVRNLAANHDFTGAEIRKFGGSGEVFVSTRKVVEQVANSTNAGFIQDFFGFRADAFNGRDRVS